MFNFREYKQRHDRLPDRLLWAGLVSPTVALQKDGSFLSVIAYRGPDVESSTPAELGNFRARLNNALRRFGAAYCLHFDAQRHEAPGYPEAAWPNLATRLIDEERRDRFTGQAAGYETSYHVAVTYLPPEEAIHRAGTLLVENAPADEQTANPYRAQLRAFMEHVANFAELLAAIMPTVRVLATDDFLTYLHSTVSLNRHRVATPDVPFYLDHLLVDTPVVPGLTVKIGDTPIRTISVRAFPSRTLPALLDRLNQQPFPFRWVTRYIPLDKAGAVSELESIRRKWFSKRKGIAVLLREAITDSTSALVDVDAEQKANAVGSALAAIGADEDAYGYFTLTVTVWGTPSELTARERAVLAVINDLGFVAEPETLNAYEAWLGSLPGNPYADVRRPLVSSRNLCDLAPLSAVWAGPTTNPHLGGAPLITTITDGATPFRFNNFVGDVGHFTVLGPTGSGKSTTLALIAAQWMKYANARVIAFDKGASIRALTLCSGGRFYRLGAPGAPSFMPLADIEQESERLWAHTWLCDILALEGMAVEPAVKEEVWRALNTLATNPPRMRTLTVYCQLVQSQPIREALRPFTLEGAYGAIFDGSDASLPPCDFQTFEMELVMEMGGALTPLLTYLFHRLDRSFDGRPTLLMLDEAWLFLDHGSFARKIKDWAKTLRARNVSLCLSTQSIADISSSAIGPHLIQSCPTKVFLPDPAANDPLVRPLYESFGLNARQIDLLATATPKRDYYFHSPDGNRLYRLDLGPVALAIFGAKAAADHRWMSKHEHLPAEAFTRELLGYRTQPAQQPEEIPA